jgi:hypothetical protein
MTEGEKFAPAVALAGTLETPSLITVAAPTVKLAPVPPAVAVVKLPSVAAKVTGPSAL